MNKKLIKKLKEELKEEEKNLEEQLKSFAKKNKKKKEDWKTNFPRFSDGGSSGDLDIAAEEVEEYSNLLPVEYLLETRLENIKNALDKIDTKEYGICEECGEKISLKRLKAHPEARFCIDCKKKKLKKIE